MTGTAIEKIRRMRYTITLLLCLCSGMAGFYWAHVSANGDVHMHGHGVFIAAFAFTFAALVFFLVVEVLALRAQRVTENIRAINLASSGPPLDVAPVATGAVPRHARELDPETPANGNGSPVPDCDPETSDRTG